MSDATRLIVERSENLDCSLSTSGWLGIVLHSGYRAAPSRTNDRTRRNKAYA